MNAPRRTRVWVLALLAALALAPAEARAQRFRAFWRNWARMAWFPAPEMAGEGEHEPTPAAITIATDGDRNRRLKQIEQLLEARRLADVAGELGRLLQDDSAADVFTPRDESQQRDYAAFRAELLRLLKMLPPEGLEAYRLQFEAAARAQLALALLDGGDSRLRAVTDRFPLTAAAAEAMYRLAHWHYEHAQYDAAAACIARLRTDQEGAAPIEPGLTCLEICCHGALGRRDLLPGALALLRTRWPASGLRIAGRDLARLPEEDDAAAAALAVAVDLRARAGYVRLEDWCAHRGGRHRNPRSSVESPFLAPRWSVDLVSSAETRQAIDYRWQSYREGGTTAIPALLPLVVGNVVLVRTANGAAAFDLDSGNRLWTHPSDDQHDNSGFEQLVWNEPAGGAFAADSECFYLLGHTLSDLLHGLQGSQAPWSTLSAREFAGSRQAALRWQVGDADDRGELPLAGARFLGPPLPVAGSLYILAERMGRLELVVLMADSGRVDWTLPLGQVEQTQDPLRHSGGATISIWRDQVAVCATSGGVLIAIDLPARALAWAHKYSRRAPSENFSGSDDLVDNAEDETSRLDQRESWLDATALIAGDRVLNAAIDSDELACLDAATGRLVWTCPRGDGLYVAGANDTCVVVVGRRQIQGWRLADGQPAWSECCTLPEGVFPSGRGLVSATHVFVPLTSARIVRINLSTGVIDEQFASPRETVPGNLVGHRGLILSQGPFVLEAFDERPALEDAVAKALARNPDDPEALARLGDLRLADGLFDEALDAFRRSYAHSRDPRTRSRLVSALLDSARRDIQGGSVMLDELDRLLTR